MRAPLRLTKRNYYGRHANEVYMSVSQYKAFEKCEECALSEVKGHYVRPYTSALLLGNYVDAYFEGTLPRFTEKYPKIFKKKDGTLKSDFEHANTVIAAIERQPLMTHLLGGTKQKIMTGNIAGVPVKIKMDSYIPGECIADLKCMRDFEPIYVPEQGRLAWYEAWRYDLQGAIYQEIVYQNTGEQLPFILIAATKEPVPDVDVIQIRQEILDFELSQFAERVVRYDAIKRGLIEPTRCEKCDYCKQTKIINEIRITEEITDE